MPLLRSVRARTFAVAALASVALASGCSSDEPADAGASDNQDELRLKELSVSVGSLSPALSNTVADYKASFEGHALVDIVAIPVQSDATVTIDSAPGTKHRVVAPLGQKSVTVTLTRGTQHRDYHVMLDRSGDYVAEAPVTPTEKSVNPEPPSSFGYGYPTLSPDGRFVAVSFIDHGNIILATDIFRIDGESPVLEAHLPGYYSIPGQFCGATECLWMYSLQTEMQPEHYYRLDRGAGDWTTKSPDWNSPIGHARDLLSTDAPLVQLDYDSSLANDVQLLPMLADGSNGPPEVLTGLTSRSLVGSHHTTVDRTLITHSDPTAGFVPSSPNGPGTEGWGELEILEKKGSVWSVVQKLSPATPIVGGAYGYTHALSDDGKRLFIGNSYAEINGLKEAGEIEEYARGPKGYALVRKIQAPTPVEFSGFGGLLLGDPNTGELLVEAVEEQKTVLYRLNDHGATRSTLDHPGGALRASKDGHVVVGVAGGGDFNSPVTLRIYR
jgi:hypothetical protein